MRTGSPSVEVTTNVIKLGDKKVSTQELTSTARKASMDAIEASRKVGGGYGTHGDACTAHSDAAITWAKLADVQRTGMRPGGKIAVAKQKFHEKAATYHQRQQGMQGETYGNPGKDNTSQGKKPKGKKGEEKNAGKTAVKPTKNSSGVKVLKDSRLAMNAWSDAAREASAAARRASKKANAASRKAGVIDEDDPKKGDSVAIDADSSPADITKQHEDMAGYHADIASEGTSAHRESSNMGLHVKAASAHKQAAKLWRAIPANKK